MTCGPNSRQPFRSCQKGLLKKMTNTKYSLHSAMDLNNDQNLISYRRLQTINLHEETLRINGSGQLMNVLAAAFHLFLFILLVKGYQ